MALVESLAKNRRRGKSVGRSVGRSVLGRESRKVDSRAGEEYILGNRGGGRDGITNERVAPDCKIEFELAAL